MLSIVAQVQESATTGDDRVVQFANKKMNKV